MNAATTQTADQLRIELGCEIRTFLPLENSCIIILLRLEHR